MSDGHGRRDGRRERAKESEMKKFRSTKKSEKKYIIIEMLS